MQPKILRIASRKSPLAIKQAEFIQTSIQKHHPDVEIKIIGFVTEGDKRLSMPLASVGGKGLFVKELEQALLAEHADIAVHSMKDVPTELPPSLTIPTVCTREDPRDVFISQKFENFYTMPKGAVIGTASLRRQCFILNLRPDLKVEILRGNLPTRLKKLEEEHYDAIILAAAGLKRSGLSDHIKHYFHWETFIPAVGQGILGIECRADDVITQNLIKPLHDHQTSLCLAAERSLNRHLQGGCQVPIAAHAKINNNYLELRAMVGHPDGSILIRAAGMGNIDNPENLGNIVAEKLISYGADKILQEAYRAYGNKEN